jgi:hypothetical protein
MQPPLCDHALNVKSLPAFVIRVITMQSFPCSLSFKSPIHEMLKSLPLRDPWPRLLWNQRPQSNWIDGSKSFGPFPKTSTARHMSSLMDVLGPFDNFYETSTIFHVSSLMGGPGPITNSPFEILETLHSQSPSV